MLPVPLFMIWLLSTLGEGVACPKVAATESSKTDTKRILKIAFVLFI